MAVNWALGLNQGNPGESFNQSFQQAQVTQRQNTARSALAALTQDPTNPKALAALAQVDPETALKFREQNIQNQKALLAQHSENIIKGAQILRQFNPTDQQSYTQALMAAQQAGVDLAGVPQEFNPQYVQGVIKVADAIKPDPQDPGIIREFDEASKRGLIPQGTTFTQYAAMRNPGMGAPVTIPYGATVTQGNLPGQMPKVSSPQEAAALPPGTKFMMPDGRIGTVPGGAGGNVSSGFPSGR